ncbi:MAG TPA: hypothetical protein PLA94_00855 [Myxococcota bacterium]|nr:hypothetical protein [Myxococcota bacterium]HND28506.1 hypothetical protein [Myxococcota bacterium]
MRLILLSSLLAGCSAEYGSAKESWSGDTSSNGDWASDDTGGGGEAPQDTAPPEQEDDFLKLEPAATDAYVFVANTSRNTVTRIAVPSLAVLTTEVGKIPTRVVTTADYKKAITLNEGSDSVSIIDAETLAVTDVPIRPNFNRLALSDDGHWVMCWYDPTAESQGSSGGVQSFNEASLVNVDSGTHTPMVVGFNPQSVKWTEDGQKALVVSDASLAVIDLTQNPPDISLIELSDDPLNAPTAEEVELSPDGNWAFVRQFGATDLAVVSLTDRSVQRIALGGNPTDLDLSPDGARITIVSRDAHKLYNLDPADPFAALGELDLPADSPYGSVLFAGPRPQAILYTTATRLDRYAVWDLLTDTITERPLVKPIQTIGVSPTGGSLLIFHTLADAPDASASNPFNGHWAMTQIDLTDFRENPLLLPAEPEGYSVSDDGHYGFFIMKDQKVLESLIFDTLLPVTVELPSLPVYLGVLPGTSTAYASQEHELGRISFYDAPANALDTITGFELNADISH